MEERFLVTGACGCLGAWAVRRLVRAGSHVVGLDLSDDPRRLRDLITADELAAVPLVRADITDLPGLERALDEHAITRVVHLAALQVPFCRESPPLGAAVNVTGTANVFEAVSRRRDRIDRVVYASSTAVYGARDRGAEDELTSPDTHYGVYKVANEGTARIYWQDNGLPSVGLRPYTVYGPARDQGLTSAPTKAMLAAVRGEPFHIPWGGPSQYQLARDAADAFLAAARAPLAGARVYNLPGARLDMQEVVDTIERVVPAAAGTITFDASPLPFPGATSFDSFDADVGGVRWTPFEDGVRETVEHFRRIA